MVIFLNWKVLFVYSLLNFSSDIVMGMKIDRTTKASEYKSRADQVRDLQNTIKQSGNEDLRKPRGKLQRRPIADMRHDAQR